MSKMWHFLVLISFGCFLGCGGDFVPPAKEKAGQEDKADAEQADALAPVRVGDVHGKEQVVLPEPSARGVVLIFLLHDCPIANGYVPEIRRLHDTYAPKGFRFYLVQVDAELEADEARQHAGEYKLPGTVLLDRQHDLVRLAGATKTPEAAVFSGAGRLLYCGRIDDVYAGFGQRRVAPTRHDLREALDAILKGQTPSPAGGPPVGCDIPPLPEGEQMP